MREKEKRKGHRNSREACKGYEVEEGMLFKNKRKLKNVVEDYKMLAGYSLRIAKSDKGRLYYVHKAENCN